MSADNYKLNPALRWALHATRIVGLDPCKQNYMSKILKYWTLISLVCFLVLNVIEVILKYEGLNTLNVGKYSNPLVLVISKWVVLQVYSSDIRRILNTIKYFWPSNKFGEGINNIIYKMHSIVQICIQVYVILTLFVVTAMLCSPIFTRKLELFFPVYSICNLEIGPCFALHYTWQIISVYISICPLFLGFDSVFILLISYGYIGIELLKYGLKDLSTAIHIDDEDTILKSIKEIIDQHNLLLHYIRDLNKVYSVFLLILFGTSIGSIICGAYLLTSQGIPPSIHYLTSFGSYTFFMLYALMLYSLAGTIIMTQTESVANEAYFINWYIKTQPRLRRQLVLLIARSQKAEQISIGKIYHLNLETYVSAVKASMTIYMLLRTLDTSNQ